MESDGRRRAELEEAIAVLEAQRPTLGDVVVDLALAPLREQLALLVASNDVPRIKPVTVLFVDVVGSTALAQRLDAEDVTEVLGELLRRFTSVVEEHRGRVFNYTGDGLVAVFGAEEAAENDAEYAIRAGLAMIDELRSMQEVMARFDLGALDVRVGLDTGPAALGGTIEGRHSLHGNTVNVAARMEQAAPAGGIRVSHNTYRLVRGLFDVTEEAPITVKGVGEPVRTFVVHRAKPRAFRQTTRGIEGLETEMIGRESELARLQEAYLRVHENGVLASVTVIADAGLGKSRLLYEFENWAEVQSRTFVVFKGRAQPHTRREPYGLLRDVLARWLEIADNDSAEVARERFVSGLAPLFVDEGDGPVHLLGHLIGLDFSASPHVRGVLADPAQIRTRAFNAAARLFRHVATTSSGGTPTVLLLEDLHWADDDTLDFLEHLVHAHHDVPVLIVASARPLLLDRRPDWTLAAAADQRIDLRPLQPAEAATLAGLLLQHLDLVPAALQDSLTAGGDGNPFFMEEIVKMLLDEGVLVASGGAWAVVPGRLDAVRVPATLMGVLQARLDALASAERAALQQAAVIGFVFWDRAVAALDERSPPCLGSLAARGFVNRQAHSTVVDATEFTFQHHLLQQFAYDSLLKRERRRYHARAAAWLAGLAAQRGAEFLGATGDHYERADDLDAAVDCFMRAAESAAARGAQSAALEYVARALALAPPGDHETVWRLLIVRESILALREDRDAHVAALDRLCALADVLDDDARRSLASLRLAAALMDQAEHREGEAAAWRTIALSENAGRPDLAALAYGQLTVACRRTNRIAEALAHAASGLALARSVGDSRVETSLLAALAGAMGDAGDTAGSRDVVAAALLLARENGDRVQEANLLNHLGVCDVALGRLTEARGSWEEALDLSREIDWAYGQAIVLLNLCGLHNLLGDYGVSLALGNEAVAIAAASHLRDLEATALLHLGIALGRRGELATARETLIRSRDLFDLNEGHHYAIDPTAALAVVCLADGDRDAAMAEIEKVLRFMASGADMTGIEEPFRVRWDCVTVLDAVGDPRVDHVLSEAHAALDAAAARLRDEADRQRFLHDLPYHRALLQAFAARRRNRMT